MMIRTKYELYPKYKPSGVEWIGEIPEGWEVRKLKWVSYLIYGSSLSNDEIIEGKVPVYGSNGIIGYHNKAISKKPCIIIGRKGSFGKINYSNIECFPIDTTYYIDKTATKNNLLWLLYVLYSLNLDSLSKDSAVPGLSREDAYDKLIIVPPIQEQHAIADFLDRETARINSIVAMQTRMIELLKEKRSALITQAVTKGLDPKANMKPSGVQWIGDIPEGWEVKKIKWASSIKNSNVNKKTEKGEKTILLCNYVDVYKNDFIDDSINFMEASATDDEIKKFILRENDVIITKDSEEWSDIAIPSFITKDFNNVICGYHLALLRPKSRDLYGKYLFRGLQSKPINTQFMVSANGITRFGLGLNSISSAYIILPRSPNSTQLPISSTVRHSRLTQWWARLKNK